MNNILFFILLFGINFFSFAKEECSNDNKTSSGQVIREKSLIKPAEWILEASIQNAPELLQGILFYLWTHSRNTKNFLQSGNVTSYNRLILVGPPGTGKTTLAYAIAHMLGWSTVLIPATTLLGRYRNETSSNIRGFIHQCTASDDLNKVIIIDELHKLFEHYENDRSDDSQSAAAFWLAIDDLEKRYPNVIVIGTANKVDRLPPEIKSRFSGKIITVPLLSKNKKIQMFSEIVGHDSSIVLDCAINNRFIEYVLDQLPHNSLRDVQFIIDTAKMFYYAEHKDALPTFPMILTKEHFQKACDQLKSESQVLQQGLVDRWYSILQKWGLVLSVAVNVISLAKSSTEFFKSPTYQKRIPLSY